MFQFSLSNSPFWRTRLHRRCRSVHPYPSLFDPYSLPVHPHFLLNSLNMFVTYSAFLAVPCLKKRRFLHDSNNPFTNVQDQPRSSQVQ